MMTSISNILHGLFVRIFGEHFNKAGFIVYVRNMQWFTISKFLTLLFSFLTTMIVARILGPETFGTLNYVLSLVTIFAVIANLGVDNVVYKELVAHKEDRERILGSAISLKLFTGIIAIAITAISLIFMNETGEIKLLVFVLALSFITQPLALLGFDFLKDNEPKYATIAQTISLFFSNTLKIASVVFFSSILLFIIVLVLENVILGLIYVFQIKKVKQRSLLLRVSKRHVLYILSLAIPLTLSGAFTEIYSRIDQIMLKHYIDEQAVGLYAAAVRLTEVWYVIPNILYSALFPALINSSENKSEYSKRFRVFALTLFVTSLVIAVVTYFLSPLLISIVYGKEFALAAPILSIYIFSLTGSFISLLLFQDLILKEQKVLLVLLPLFTAVSNVLLNIVLIPKMGMEGAAIATVASYTIVPLLYLVFRRKSVYKQDDLN